MPPLNRAFALAEVNHVTVFVRQNLNLDMAWTLDVALDINAAVFESRECFV
jgi:hypothetical protein